jgi:hypothetical protein
MGVITSHEESLEVLFMLIFIISRTLVDAPNPDSYRDGTGFLYVQHDGDSKKSDSGYHVNGFKQIHFAFLTSNSIFYWNLNLKSAI